MQQIKLNSNVITTIRGCITNEGCETVTRSSILYENTCCFHKEAENQYVAPPICKMQKAGINTKYPRDNKN